MDVERVGEVAAIVSVPVAYLQTQAAEQVAGALEGIEADLVFVLERTAAVADPVDHVVEKRSFGRSTASISPSSSSSSSSYIAAAGAVVAPAAAARAIVVVAVDE